MPMRFGFVAVGIEAGDTAHAKEFREEVQQLTRGLEPEGAAELYVGAGPVVRGIMAEEIRGLPPNEARRAALEIDRLGTPFQLER
jgi:hypothetical protein